MLYRIAYQFPAFLESAASFRSMDPVTHIHTQHKTRGCKSASLPLCVASSVVIATSLALILLPSACHHGEAYYWYVVTQTTCHLLFIRRPTNPLLPFFCFFDFYPVFLCVLSFWQSHPWWFTCWHGVSGTL